MALHPKIIDSINITATVSEIESIRYGYHHITLFFTSTIGEDDRYEIIQYKYNPVLTDYVRQFADEVNFESVGSTLDPDLQDRVWEMNPTPGEAMKITVQKLAGDNGTLDYEIIQVT